jgi:hypothetical protein
MTSHTTVLNPKTKKKLSQMNVFFVIYKEIKYREILLYRQFVIKTSIYLARLPGPVLDSPGGLSQQHCSPCKHNIFPLSYYRGAQADSAHKN